MILLHGGRIPGIPLECHESLMLPPPKSHIPLLTKKNETSEFAKKHSHEPEFAKCAPLSSREFPGVPPPSGGWAQGETQQVGTPSPTCLFPPFHGEAPLSTLFKNQTFP